MSPRIGLIGAALVAGALVLASFGSAFAQQVQPGTGYGPGMMGGYGPGGMMGGYGPRAGQAQPGTGYGAGGMMGGSGRGGMMGGWSGQQAQPLGSLDDAQAAFQRYLDATGNPSLALDEVMQFAWNYYAIVKDTTTGQGAFELLANPRTGAVFPEMGPNMMWNTEYSPMAGVNGRGMMGGLWGQQAPGGQPTVDAAKARQLAQQWLDQNQPGSGTEAPDAFPGYFTLHTTKAGTISGMLSVNAFTGQVWYHSWHGAFVDSTEA